MWGDVDETMDVVWPPVQKNHGPAVAGAYLGISDVQNAGIDLLKRTERAIPRRSSRRGGLRDGAHGLFRAPAPATGFATAWTASRITSVTAGGWETMITCEPLISTVLAPARLAIERITSVPAALSPTATTAHEGTVFQPGGPEASLNAPAATGRCVAAMIADCFSGTSEAKTSWNFAGSTMNSGAVSPFFLVGYMRWTSAELRALSLELASAPPRFSPSSGAKAATNTSARTFFALRAALLITAPPYECPTRIVGPSI